MCIRGHRRKCPERRDPKETTRRHYETRRTDVTRRSHDRFSAAPRRGGAFGPPPFAPDAPGATSTSTTTATTNPGLDALTAYLTLTATQIAGFTAIRQTAATAAAPLQTQLQTKLQALRTALAATPVVAATVTSLQIEIAALRAQLDKIQADARVQMIATLSTDERNKAAALEAAAALREEIQGAAGLGLLTASAGGPGFGGGPGGRRPR
ncbi:MAG: periplasmic heavy metal sensor [Acidobacteriota bacterium]